MSRAGEASGQVRTDRSTHLSVHPVYGPWIAFRAFIVYPGIQGPDTIPAVERNATEPIQNLLAGEVKASVELALAAALERPGEWERWVGLRDLIGNVVGSGYRYSDDQIAYHYTKSVAALSR